MFHLTDLIRHLAAAEADARAFAAGGSIGLARVRLADAAWLRRQIKALEPR